MSSTSAKIFLELIHNNNCLRQGPAKEKQTRLNLVGLNYISIKGGNRSYQHVRICTSPSHQPANWVLFENTSILWGLAMQIATNNRCMSKIRNKRESLDFYLNNNKQYYFGLEFRKLTCQVKG